MEEESTDDNFTGTPSELKEAANASILNLLPTRSKSCIRKIQILVNQIESRNNRKRVNRLFHRFI